MQSKSGRGSSFVWIAILLASVLFLFSIAPINGNALAAPKAQTISNAPQAGSSAFIPLVFNNFVPPQQCRVGQTIYDQINDTPPAYIDVTQLDTSLNGQALTAVLHLRSLPASLVFDRTGVPLYYAEYEWSIVIDADNNPLTGDLGGADYMLSAIHFVHTLNANISKPIQNAVQVNVWKHAGGGSWSYLTAATILVNSQAGTITLAGTIPGITINSPLWFYTGDYNPGGARQNDYTDCAGFTIRAAMNRTGQTDPMGLLTMNFTVR